MPSNRAIYLPQGYVNLFPRLLVNQINGCWDPIKSLPISWPCGTTNIDDEFNIFDLLRGFITLRSPSPTPHNSCSTSTIKRREQVLSTQQLMLTKQHLF
ncbi:hypothetical protein PM082_003718 [Marasmius tenuissimus]|nr:hypothetical protein PM082_003718 [Marasmius tenuissimus]